eukprot:jgi/Orpsp1_1/1176710/evm.model.c7180000058701.1
MNQENDNILFIKNWYKIGYEDNYYISKLPGKKDGISASTIGGYSIAMNKNIKDRNFKLMAGKAIDFFISEEVQMKFVESHSIISGLGIIYYNQTFCNMNGVNQICDIYLNSQPVIRPYNKTDDYDKYSTDIRSYINNYLYKDKMDAKETLEKIDDITKVYYIDYNSPIGNFSMFAPIITLSITLILYTFIFNYKLGKKFILLSKTYWFVYIFGIGLMMCYLICNIGVITLFKCHIKILVLSVGFTLTSTLLCLKLISNIPSKSNFVLSFQKNFSLFVSLAIWIDILICSLFIFAHYENVVYYKVDDMNFQRCEFPTIFSKLTLILLGLYKLLIMLLQLTLVYIEWNDIFLKIDIRLLFYSQLSAMLAIILFITFSFINNDDLEPYYLTKNIIVFSYCIINLCFNFYSRFFIPSSFYERNNINVKKYACTLAEINDKNKSEIIDSTRKSNESLNKKFNGFKEKMKNYHT